MKHVKGWWFTTTDRKLQNGDNRPIVLGETHKVEGEIIPCRYGLHLSKRIIDALYYARGPVVYRVQGSGVIVPHGNPVNKYACSERTYLSGGIDVSETLRTSARKFALDVIHLWDAPEIVRRYLETGDESIRSAASTIASATARSAASAASAAAWDAASTTARSAAWDAAWAYAWDAVSIVASAAVSATAWAAVRDKQNKRLTVMVTNDIRRSTRHELNERI